jgi:putative tryptophan/tyrosine transport system substrate-binding protein
MRRRDLLAGLLATITASALRAAEPNKVYRLAFCWHFAVQSRGVFGQRIFERLRQLGYIEGKNLIVDRYGAEDRPERYPEIARKAVLAKPDVIMVMFDNQFISQFAKETSTLPIVANPGGGTNNNKCMWYCDRQVTRCLIRVHGAARWW